MNLYGWNIHIESAPLDTKMRVGWFDVNEEWCEFYAWRSSLNNNWWSSAGQIDIPDYWKLVDDIPERK